MNKLKHWFATCWFLGFATIIGTAMAAVIGYFCYLVVTELGPAVATIVGIISLGCLTQWSVNYVDAHGWPWKPKHESEGDQHG
jgi:hypothetical protein